MQASPEPTVSVEECPIRDAIKWLLERAKAEARAGERERRATQREPFFAPVTVVVEENGAQRNFFCFSREISPGGIGLLHDMALEPGKKVVVTIPRKSAGDIIRLQSEIVWCKSCGEGWYSSGALFLDVLSPPPALNEQVNRLIVRSSDVRPGNRYGRLRTLGAPFWVQNDRCWREAIVVCECSCGTVCAVQCAGLSDGAIKSCGCLRTSLARTGR